LGHLGVELRAVDSNHYDCGQNAAACRLTEPPIESGTGDSNLAMQLGRLPLYPMS
jgi:hypothetical protein